MGDTGGKRERDGGGDADHQSTSSGRQHDSGIDAWFARHYDNGIARKCGRCAILFGSISVSRCDGESTGNESELGHSGVK